MRLADKTRQRSRPATEQPTFFGAQSVFPNATIQRAEGPMDHCEGNPPEVVDGIPDGLDCKFNELVDDLSTSCCGSGALHTISQYYQIARTYTDRSIEKLADGMRVGDMLLSHFNSSSGGTKQEVLTNLRAIRKELDNESSHKVICRALFCSTQEYQEAYNKNRALFCDPGHAAYHSVGTNGITFCVNGYGDIISDWDTILHEVIHLQGIGDLPDISEATSEQRERGEFETYEYQRETGQYPNPTEYALRNADSYAEFVKATGAPEYTGDEGWPGWAEGLLGGAIAGTVAGGVAGALLGEYGMLGDTIGLGGGLGLGAAIGGAAIGGIGALIGWLADD